MATKTEKTIKLALERWEHAGDVENDNRQEAIDDLKFTMGEQWPDEIKNERDGDNRPCITVNRVQQMVKQVVNDMRQNRAGIRVNPAGDEATEETAKVYSGLVRGIECESSAPDQYIVAGESCVTHGQGYFRVRPEYEKGSFNQRLVIEAIRNFLSVRIDPSAKAPDKSDAKWGFISDDMPRSEFESKYPDAKACGWKDDDVGDDWLTEDVVRVAEYFEISDTKDTLYQFVDGTTGYRSDMPGTPPKDQVANERTEYRSKLIIRKITSKDVLEETEYDIDLLPIVQVIGEEYNIEGKVYRMGLVRHAKGPQMVYNYSRTAVVEQIALAPKAPYIIGEGQVEGYEDIWGTANTRNHAYLPYKPMTISGQSVPPPQRQMFAGVPAGSMADLQLASEEIKAVTGIYDAALGQKSNEVSGKAILARQREADNATYHYVDALNRAIKLCGKILIKFIPIIYDTARTVRTVTEDGKERLVDVNQPTIEEGIRKNDLTVGKYDVAITTGPSYETKRIEAANGMMQFMQAAPQAASAIVDLIAKNMDWPGAEQISARLRAMLPPEIQSAGEESEIEIPPQVVAKMQEMAKVIQDLQNAVQEALAKNADLESKTALEDRKLDIEEFKAYTDRAEAIMKSIPQPEQVTPELISAVVQNTIVSLLQPANTPVVEPTGIPGTPQGALNV